MRPSVSVVMPFAGDVAAARAALATLASLTVGAGDQLILADNAGGLGGSGGSAVQVIDASAERSPSHARNAGARHAHGDWILFVDADCSAPPDLLDRYFIEPVVDDVGALVGEVLPAGAAGASLAERYGVARSFLSQQAHLAHRYLPRAAAANLLVRRTAFEQLGGFYEGLRAAEDTDFSWRLQHAGWRLELRAGAAVEHRYRSSVGDLRRQWRGYAAGRAWLARRYPGFTPEPAVARFLRRSLPRPGSRSPRDSGNFRPLYGACASQSGAAARPRRERAAFLALDGLLAGEELAGLVLSNRPRRSTPSAPGVEVVLVADRFPAPDDPLVEFALSLDRARVEAAARPERIDPATAGLRIDYREDDGALARVRALTRMLLRHPLRCLLDRLARIGRRGRGAPALLALAPAVRRVHRDGRHVRVHALGPSDANRAVAARLAALSETRHELHLPLPSVRR